MSHINSMPLLVGTAALNFPSINASATAELTITVTGAAVGDGVILGMPAVLEASIAVIWYAVTAANTVTIRVRNHSGGAVDPVSATWKAIVVKR